MPWPTEEPSAESNTIPEADFPMWAAAAGAAAGVSLAAGTIYSLQPGDKERLLQIPDCAMQIIFQDETKGRLSSIIRECLSASPDSYDPSNKDARYLRRYIHELGRVRNEIRNIEKAEVGYYPFGGADTLTIDTLAPYASIHLMTHHAEFAVAPGFVNMEEYFRHFAAALTGTFTDTNRRYGNFDSGFGIINVTLQIMRAVIGQLYRKLGSKESGQAAFPEVHVASFDLTKDGDVMFNSPDNQTLYITGGVAIWIKDDNETKLFLCKKINIETANNPEETKNDIKGVHALLSKVSKDAGTLVLQKAVHYALLPPSADVSLEEGESSEEKRQLAQEMMSPPDAKVLAAVCDAGPPMYEDIPLPVHVQGLGLSAEVDMPIGFGHGNIARVYTKASEAAG